MTRSLLILFVYLTFLFLGLRAPFILALGYVWTDLFSPHLIAYSLITDLPLSAIMAAAMVGAYLLFDRAAPPRLVASNVLLLAWALWITLTTTWAEVPDAAWDKWNWAIKVVLSSFFMSYIIRSRIQIEAMILTIIISLFANIFPFGLKTLINGGGYGSGLGLLEGNSGLAEGSTLALVSVATIPLILFIKRQSLIMPRFAGSALIYYGTCLFSVAAALGSFARTGLVALVALVGLTLMRTRRKLLLVIVVALSYSALPLLVNDRWQERMQTITSPTGETSAMGRIAVWLWTIDYASQHPLGGGFRVDRINSYVLPLDDGSELVVQAKAFHSIYFEVLGEHGLVGLGLFVSLLGCFFVSLYRLMRQTRGIAELAWLNDLASSLMITMAIYLSGGAFVGVAFQSPLYFLIALGVSADQYYRRCRSPAVAAAEIKTPAVSLGR